MGRTPYRQLTAAMNAYLNEDPAFLGFPARIQRLIVAWAENSEHPVHGGPFMKELWLRKDGHVPREDVKPMPTTVVTVGAMPLIAGHNAPPVTASSVAVTVSAPRAVEEVEAVPVESDGAQDDPDEDDE